MTEEFGVKWISGFWRRIGALLVDIIILGVIGLGLGLVLEKQFVELGSWGRLIGFFIALVYFGVMNSKIYEGQTLGKKALKIKVVNADNQSIDVLRSFARYSVLGIPYFLNGAYFTNDNFSLYLLYLISIVVFCGSFSIIYLYIFNRVSRQSLHDLLVGTYVVNVEVERQPVGVIWKPHFIVVVAVFVLGGVVGSIFISNIVNNQSESGLLVSQQSLIDHTLVKYATVSSGQTFSLTGNGDEKTSYLKAQVILSQDKTLDGALAQELAISLTSSIKDFAQKDKVQITLTYGYDIGIASKVVNSTHTFDPKELQFHQQVESNKFLN